eukprot:793308-Lingulodinium_polyedra.AAC.1
MRVRTVFARGLFGRAFRHASLCRGGARLAICAHHALAAVRSSTRGVRELRNARRRSSRMHV